MQISDGTVLWWVDTQSPEIGDTTFASIMLGAEEAYLYGPTGYMTGKRLIFTTREHAEKAFSELWSDTHQTAWC